MSNERRSERINRAILEEFENDFFNVSQLLTSIEEQVALLQDQLPKTLGDANVAIDEKAADTIQQIQEELRDEVKALLSSEIGEYSGRLKVAKEELSKSIEEQLSHTVNDALIKVDHAREEIAKSTNDASDRLDAYMYNMGDALKRLDNGKWLRRWLLIFYVFAFTTTVSSIFCAFTVTKLTLLYYS